VPNHDGRETPHQIGVRHYVFFQQLFTRPPNGRQLLVGIERRAAKSREVFRTGGDAFAFQSLKESACPADHFIGARAPAAVAQRIINLLAEQLQVEHGCKIDVDAKLMQPSARRASEVLRLFRVARFLDIGNRRRFTDNLTKTVDATVFLINGHERTVGEFGPQRASELAQIGGGVDVARKEYHAAWLHGIKQPSRFSGQLRAVKPDE